MREAIKHHLPKFRVEKTNPPRVFIQCSSCGIDLREMKPSEKIKVTRAYYCNNCEPGVVVLNPPSSKSDGEK